MKLELDKFNSRKEPRFPISSGTWEKLKPLKARLRLCRWTRLRMLAVLELMEPVRQLQLRSRPITWPLTSSHSTPSQSQQLLVVSRLLSKIQASHAYPMIHNNNEAFLWKIALNSKKADLSFAWHRGWVELRETDATTLNSKSKNCKIIMLVKQKETCSVVLCKTS